MITAWMNVFLFLHYLFSVLIHASLRRSNTILFYMFLKYICSFFIYYTMVHNSVMYNGKNFIILLYNCVWERAWGLVPYSRPLHWEPVLEQTDLYVALYFIQCFISHTMPFHFHAVCSYEYTEIDTHVSCQDNDYSLVDSLIFIDSQDYRYRKIKCA